MHIKRLGLTFSDNALQTHHATQQTRCQGSRRDMFAAEAALQTNEELFVLLGVSGIY